MKLSFSKYSLIVVSLLYIFGISACSKDNPVIEQDYLTKNDIVEGRYISTCNDTIVTDNQMLASNANELQPSDFEELKAFVFLNAKTHKAKIASITYNTEVNNVPVVASGIIVYPIDIQPRGVIFMPHYFISNKNQAPSKKLLVPHSLYAILGYIVITPDQIGFGTTVDYPIPYIENDITGKTFTDMLFAAQEYLLLNEIKTQKSISIGGYSLGGNTAIALQRYIELHYKDKIPINLVVAGGGMYEPIECFKKIREIQTSGYPASIPQVILSENYWRNLNLDINQIFIDPLLSNYQDWIVEKNYDMSYINGLLGYNVNNFLNSDFINNNDNPQLVKLIGALEQNKFDDWTAIAPITLIHSNVDTYVPFSNAQLFYSNMLNKGCNIELIQTDVEHVSSIKTFYLTLFNKLKKV